MDMLQAVQQQACQSCTSHFRTLQPSLLYGMLPKLSVASCDSNQHCWASCSLAWQLGSSCANMHSHLANVS